MKPGGQDEQYVNVLNNKGRLEKQLKSGAGVGKLIPKYMSDKRKQIIVSKLISDYDNYFITGIAKGEIDPPDAISDVVIAAVEAKKEELGISDALPLIDDEIKNKIAKKLKNTQEKPYKDVTGEKSPKKKKADAKQNKKPRRNREDLEKQAKKLKIPVRTKSGKPRRLEYIERDIKKSKGESEELSINNTVFENRLQSISSYLFKNYNG